VITWSVLTLPRLPLLVLIGASFVGVACIWDGDRVLGDNPDAGAEDGFEWGTGGSGAGGNGSGTGGSGAGGDLGLAGSPGAGGAIGGIGGAGVGGAIAGTGGAGIGGAIAGAGGAGIGGAIAGAGGAVQDGGSDAAQPDSGAADLTPPGDTGVVPVACNQTGTPIRVWSFASSVEGWDLGDPGTLIWTAAKGSPDPGALQVDWSIGQPVHPRRLEALGDLRGRIVTARVWVDAGVNVAIKVFVQTGNRWWWADGGIVTPPQGQWTCVSLDINNPGFSRLQYDPSDVQVLGVELQTTGTGRAFIDQVAY